MFDVWNTGEKGKIGYMKPTLSEKMSSVTRDKAGKVVSGVWNISWEWAVRKWADDDKKKATPAQVDKYELAHTAMVDHENAHLAIDRKNYSDANVAGHAGKTEVEAGEAMDELTDQTETENKKFDSDTSNGTSATPSTHMRYPEAPQKDG